MDKSGTDVTKAALQYDALKKSLEELDRQAEQVVADLKLDEHPDELLLPREAYALGTYGRDVFRIVGRIIGIK